MHDPMTVAFDIKLPWRRCKPWPANLEKWEELTPKQQRGREKFWREGYRESLITIWHNDPCRDGTDDSCGFSTPKLTKKQRQTLKGLAWAEAQQPWLRYICAKSVDNPMVAECLCRAGLIQVADALRIPLTTEQAMRGAIRLTHNQLDNLRSCFCAMPGWHTNGETIDKHQHEELAMQLYVCLARYLLRKQRRWYQQPRWHIHHWRFQIHPWQDFKRWLFPPKEANAEGA